MKLNQFNPPKYEDIKEKFFNGEELNQEEIATLVALVEIKDARLQAISRLSQPIDLGGM
jgi:hypothetical protein